jgi:hypothetical protein
LSDNQEHEQGSGEDYPAIRAHQNPMPPARLPKPPPPRTRLDVLANSELQVCHYRLRRFVTMSGPARVTVSAGGITVESGKAVIISKETCAVPQASNFQGGVVTRGASFKQ